jgi:hypothetical protein
VSLEVEQAVKAEVARHCDALRDLIAKHPESVRLVCLGLLGEAVGVCDSFGVDVEEFVAKLRSTFGKPGVLVPPKSRAS